MSFCTQIEPRYTCNQLKDIEGIPMCECTEISNRLKLETGNAKFLVCGKIAGWLLERGITADEINILKSNDQ
jgi:hypothetical protein